ncbi:beta-fructofuranosidase [Paenibacillus sp. V4I3]|uniref:GH32 C-terminal domain-containing protein n=1 Tax=unclassified Paenibacillus TaxID=185978 RepID=UPI0027849F2E|nr:MULTISPECIES: GH32 C-terminal domain-containing protein [unclassified Paenibacillus]MDQ0877342.1 beta-fructofuranosidase [Paenibacillus sp. V4I3]MDQ0886793.1 beta-fructofuranosidase [Paenibacillus sp. V4I9]
MEPIAYWSFDEGQGRIAHDPYSGNGDSIQYALTKGRFQPPQDPVWRKGIRGCALLFDGYSTWLQRPADQCPSLSGALTITAWIAPRSYDFGDERRLAAIVNQHDRERCEGYIFGLSRHGSWSLQLALGEDWVEVGCYDHPLPKGVWSFVCATYESVTGLLKLYLNGCEVAVKQHSKKDTLITTSQEDLIIGRNNKGVILAEAFTMNMFDGLMDELCLYDLAMSEDDIARAYRDYLSEHGGAAPAIPYEDLAISRANFAQDRHRPVYHLTSPGHWMNEPHAPIYFNGQYHLFYQFNPNGPFWHYIHWGHWVSEDLVHWRDLPAALAPEPGLDPDGIWSGSAAYDEHGYPALFYTAGNNACSPNQSVGLARTTYLRDGDIDLKTWVKHPEPIVVQEPGVGYFGEFRDPYVWKENEEWIMLVGTGIEGQGGTAMVYRSANMTDWTCEGPLYVSNYQKYPYLGVVWELPVLLPLKRNGEETGKHILLISPWGPEAKVEVNYWIGRWEGARYRFIPDHEEPRLIDVGDFHFTGPSGMVDPITGRSLLFTIAQGERTPEIDYDCGWSHGAGIPISLTLRKDGLLGIEPIEEIRQLRGMELLNVRDLSLDEANENLQHIRSDTFEVELTFGSEAEHQYGISLRRTPDGEEETVLFYDQDRERLGVNRNKTTLDTRERTTGIQEGLLELQGEPLQLRVFVDRSLIEVYANGLKSLTTRAYPSRLDALGLLLHGDRDIRITSMQMWEMKPAFQVSV